MSSEQADWANRWLVRHTPLSVYQPGFTYMFEAVYAANQVVVSYPYEECVLLAVTNQQGQEISGEMFVNRAFLLRLKPKRSGNLPRSRRFKNSDVCSWHYLLS